MKENPLPTVAGKRTEGTLLAQPVKRIVAKSKFLRALEKKQKPPEVITIDDARRNARLSLVRK